MIARGSSIAPVLVAGLVMVVWGATPVMTKLAVAEFDPLLLGLLRTLIGGMVAAPIIAAMDLPLPKDRVGLGLLVLSAAAGLIVFPILYSFGQRQTSAMHGGMILAALPIFTGSYVALLERRWPGRRWIAGCILALAGEVALIVLRGGGGTPVSILGDVLVLFSALLVASGYVAGGRLGQLGYRAIATTFWGIVLAAAVVAPVVGVILARQGWPIAGLPAWGAILWLAVITSIVGYIGWYWALAVGGIARTATMQFFQPISGLILAAILLGERLTLPLLAASALILAGVWLAQRR
ncbi:MAG: DMT family transporter [Dongiaceae bacterium]